MIKGLLEKSVRVFGFAHCVVKHAQRMLAAREKLNDDLISYENHYHNAISNLGICSKAKN